MRNLQYEILKELNDAKVSIFVYKQVLFLCSEVVYILSFLRMFEDVTKHMWMDWVP